ncbi:hypothetical protein WC7_02156 [Citrobacter sp. KTE151]|nr:hypothetical protein WC7_02156 [Citrobacter sp. KTE151]
MYIYESAKKYWRNKLNGILIVIFISLIKIMKNSSKSIMLSQS